MSAPGVVLYNHVTGTREPTSRRRGEVTIAMPDSAETSTAPVVSWWAGTILLIGAALHATMILEAKPLQSANDRSRWCTVWSLLERNTYQIDAIRQVPGWDTIDLIYDDGHFYSTKPPILATWVTGVVWGVTRVTRWDLLKDTQSVASVTLLIVNGLPLLLSWFLWARLLEGTVRSAWGQAVLLAIGVFATLLTPFAVTLNNHSVGAAGAMLTVYFLWKILHREPLQFMDFLACGFGAGWTCAHELPAALLGIASFLLCLSRSFRLTLLAYAPAAVIPLAAFLFTNWLATGTLQPAYASYGTEKYRFVMEGVPSYWLEPKGVDLNVDSIPVYIFHCFLGHHGIFSLTPVWLLLFPGWVLGIRSLFRSGERWAALPVLSGVSLLMTVIVLAFYLSRTENYNYGGNSCGLRWALWLTPFWLVSLIPVFSAWSDRRWLHGLLIPLFAVSAFSAWSRVDNPWRQPWIFTWMEARELIDFRDKRPPLPHPLWTWIAALPDARDGHPRWMEFVNASSPTGVCRMRISVSTPVPDQPAQVEVTVTRTCGDEPPTQVCRVLVDREKLAAGTRPAECIRWTDASVTPQQQQADLAFLRGLPLVKGYEPGVVRYRKTLLRTDAFRCQHAFATVVADAPVGGRKWRHQCHVMLCEELPLGMAEVEFIVTDVATGLQLHQERWQAAACEPPPLPQAQWSPRP